MLKLFIYMSDKKKLEKFEKIYTLAKEKYENEARRLAAEGWEKEWQVVISTIMSAQNRDESTIHYAEILFEKYPTLDELANAKLSDVQTILNSINYYKNKSKYIIKAANQLIQNHEGVVPDTIPELLKLTGVGRKTANLVLTEVHDKPGICVDTHVHRISNVFGIVDTKNADQTEKELKKLVPKKYWKKINRYFVLWGQDVAGRDEEALLNHLKS